MLTAVVPTGAITKPYGATTMVSPAIHSTRPSIRTCSSAAAATGSQAVAIKAVTISRAPTVFPSPRRLMMGVVTTRALWQGPEPPEGRVEGVVTSLFGRLRPLVLRVLLLSERPIRPVLLLIAGIQALASRGVGVDVLRPAVLRATENLRRWQHLEEHELLGRVRDLHLKPCGRERLLGRARVRRLEPGTSSQTQRACREARRDRSTQYSPHPCRKISEPWCEHPHHRRVLAPGQQRLDDGRRQMELDCMDREPGPAQERHDHERREDLTPAVARETRIWERDGRRQPRQHLVVRPLSDEEHATTFLGCEPTHRAPPAMRPFVPYGFVMRATSGALRELGCYKAWALITQVSTTPAPRACTVRKLFARNQHPPPKTRTRLKPGAPPGRQKERRSVRRAGMTARGRRRGSPGALGAPAQGLAP